MLKLKRVSEKTVFSKTFSFSWIFMWSLSYIVCAVIKPDITIGILGKTVAPVNPIHLGFGLLLLIALLFNIKGLLFTGGIVEVVAGVGSWVGLVKWNVPWTVVYDPSAQISMAILDFVAAAFLFYHSQKV